MRISILSSFLFFAINTFAQSGISWGPEVIVSDGSTYGKLRPRAAITGIDVPVVIYGKTSAAEDLFISRWNGASFDPPVSILPAGKSAYVAGWTGPDIASKGDTVIAVFKLEPIDFGNVYSVRSTDGGITFSDTIRVDNHDVGVAWMPSMDIDAAGNPVVTYMAHDGGWINAHYVIANSNDAGVTYNPEMVVVSSIPGEACDCCPAEVVIDGQKQVMLFRNNDNNIRDTHGVLSLDDGVTFPYQTNIDNLAWNINGCPATGPDGVFSGNDLLTAYASSAEGTSRVYLSSSSANSNLTFNTRTTMVASAAGNESQNFPRISSSNDTIVMAWEENDAGNKDIYCSVAIPGLDPVTSLTSFKTIANATTVGLQSNPEILYKNGFVHLFYEDEISGSVLYRRGTVNVNLGLSEQNEKIRVHPNPSATGEFYISGASEINSIVNAQGVAVPYSLENEGSLVKLRIEASSVGMYFLKYSTEAGGTEVMKLTVR